MNGQKLRKDKGNEDKVVSRREFLKKAGKLALPLIAISIVSPPIKSFADTLSPNEDKLAKKYDINVEISSLPYEYSKKIINMWRKMIKISKNKIINKDDITYKIYLKLKKLKENYIKEYIKEKTQPKPTKKKTTPCLFSFIPFLSGEEDKKEKKNFVPSDVKAHLISEAYEDLEKKALQKYMQTINDIQKDGGKFDTWVNEAVDGKITSRELVDKISTEFMKLTIYAYFIPYDDAKKLHDEKLELCDEAHRRRAAYFNHKEPINKLDFFNKAYLLIKSETILEYEKTMLGLGRRAYKEIYDTYKELEEEQKEN